MPLLPSEQRVIAVDLRGHGDSDKPADGYRMSDLADDVIGLMDRLDVPSAVVVGHSMGSFVAQALVERAPRRVSALVLLSSAPRAVNDVVTVLQLAVESLTDPIDAEFVRGFQFATVAQPVPEAFLDAAIVNSRRMPAAVWKKALAGLMEFQPRLPRSSVRTLVLGGTRDSVFSVDEQTALARQYPIRAVAADRGRRTLAALGAARSVRARVTAVCQLTRATALRSRESPRSCRRRRVLARRHLDTNPGRR